MKEVRLSGIYSHLTALVDDEDYEFIRQYRWTCSGGGASARIDSKTVSMHRLIMNTPHGLVVDHLNHNRLDNRRSNLRNCTQRENMQNRRDKRVPKAPRQKQVGAAYRAGKGHYRALYKGRDLGKYVSKDLAMAACLRESGKS